jgi:hypothetical protein
MLRQKRLGWLPRNNLDFRRAQREGGDYFRRQRYALDGRDARPYKFLRRLTG